MLKLLLDEHISPDVAKGLRRRNRTLDVRYIVEWEDGYFLGQEDSPCLREAAVQGLTLVTYDRRTIPPLLKTWAEEERIHGGVVFVDEKTISPADIGGRSGPLQASHENLEIGTGRIESISCGAETMVSANTYVRCLERTRTQATISTQIVVRIRKTGMGRALRPMSHEKATILV